MGTPPRASTLPNFSHIEHKMPSRLTCSALLAAGLLSSGLSVANAEVLFEDDGMIPKETVDSTDEWVADATCVKLTAELYAGVNEKFAMALFETADAEAFVTALEGEEYNTRDEFIEGLEDHALEDGVCVFDESARCETIVTTEIGTGYVAGFANGNDYDLEGSVRLETCSSTAETLIEEEGELQAYEIARSPAASGLTCAVVTMSLPDGTDENVVSGVFLEAKADAIEDKAVAGEYTTTQQVYDDFEADALAGSLCTFGDSATCTFTAELDPKKSYVAGVANGNADIAVKGKVVVETCTDAEALDLGLTSNPAVAADSDMGKATDATTSADT